ncbi:MAG: DEAD/DEAH box helicase [Phycisphaeraceae bacterium]|nr:DEAD/DEAH box helicase [Phycisphaeraceae bacterium]
MNSTNPSTVPNSDAPAAETATPEAHGQLMPHAPAKGDLYDDSVLNFEQLGLRSSVLKGVKEAGFERPTKIQAMLIPPIMAGKDMLGQAKTGSGKTAAFALPLLHALDKDAQFQALVLVPTRELCVQVAREVNELGKHTPIKAAAVYGGERINQQVETIKRGAHIVVSTPGRLMDMMERGYVHLRAIKHVVLDEVDRMLDIGFREDIRRILKQCPSERQTVFVSATLPEEVERLARGYSKNPERVIAIAKGAMTTAAVRQFYLAVQPWDRRRLLLHLLTHEEPALTVVFCRTKRTVDELAEFLVRHKIDAHPMHGDMYQSKRNKVIEKLHKGDLSVLVASDLAARGLDVDGITHVINYDIPEDAEVYVHRIGRTARIGREGVAWTFVMPDQGELLTNVENLINAEVPKLDYPDFKPSPPPPGRVALQPGGPVSEAKANQFNRYAFSATPPLPVVAKETAKAAADPRFPGGVVPSKLPPKRMFGKVKTAHGMKQAIDATLKTDPPPPPKPDAP